MEEHPPDDPSPSAASSQPVSLSVLTPVQVVQHFTEDDWESFVLEALLAALPKYARIERRGGSGDKGRDVIAYSEEPPTAGPIDLYQCKAYGKPLGAADIWTELGKLCVFTHEGHFPVPRHYRFAAPFNVTTHLGNLFDAPKMLKSGLMDNWAVHCHSKISAQQTYPLTGALRAYVETFDFSIVHYCPVTQLLELHRKTPNWSSRFKRDYPVRPHDAPPPPEVQPQEMRYIRQLLDAYGQHANASLKEVRDLAAYDTLRAHFHGCRTDFFMADGLNRFYRDQFPAGAFEHIKSQVHQGVRNTALAPHPNGYHRVCATLAQAAGLTLAQTEYVYCVQPGDKSGICHHLANEDELKWVQP